ncbi:MAG: SdpI family protein [Candidatus Acidiferrum sp.]
MTWKYYLTGILLTAAMVVATAVAYPHLPGAVATHWNLRNQADGYSAKWTLFVIGPGLMAGIMLLWRFLPWLSPKNFEVDSFRSTYFQIMLIIVSLLAYFNAVVLWAGMGYSLNVGRAIVGGVCLLFALLGNLMGKVRRNFYIGVRTPWALANERVWNATHRFAAKTFVAGGVVGLALTAVGLQGRAVIVVLLAAALIPAVYSLAFYKQLERRGEL